MELTLRHPPMGEVVLIIPSHQSGGSRGHNAPIYILYGQKYNFIRNSQRKIWLAL